MVRLTPGMGIDENGVIAPDGNWFAWISNSGGSFQLWIARKDGTGARALAPADSRAIPVWSGDAKWIGLAEKAISSATGESRPARPGEFRPRVASERVVARSGAYSPDWTARVIRKEEFEFKRTVEMFRLPDALEPAPEDKLLFDVSPDESWFLMRVKER